MFRILLLVLEFLSCKSHRFVTSSSIQTGSGVLQPGMKLDEFVLIERLHSWSSDKQSQSSGSDASWIAANSSSLELVQTMPTGLLQMKSSEDLPANVTNSIGSKYKVLKRLASGSFGEVWKAVGPDTKTVAIKLFYTEGDNGECNEVKQLIEDAEAKSHSARLYIAKCLESRLSSEPNKIGYVVQEYGGRPLFELGLENRTALQVLRDAREILFQLLSVLDLLESRGLSHHDLKPANIVYKRIKDGSILIKVVDWGALVNEAHVTVSESCPWTPAYQPPEHREDEKCYTKGMIAKYDIYAAGLVYAVALLLAEGESSMTKDKVKYEQSIIEEFWYSRSNVFSPDVMEEMEDYADKHELVFPPEDEQMLGLLTSERPGDRPTAMQAIDLIRRRNFLHGLTSSSRNSCYDSSFVSKAAAPHRKYSFYQTKSDHVTLTIFKNGNKKGERTLGFHLNKCIDETHQDSRDLLCCQTPITYKTKSGLTGMTSSTNIDVTFCAKKQTLDHETEAANLVLNFVESGDKLKEKSGHILHVTEFSKRDSC